LLDLRRWSGGDGCPGGAVKRQREDLRLGLVLGFAAGIVASLISISVMLEVLERLPPP
jgi:hypothetical protein